MKKIQKVLIAVLSTALIASFCIATTTAVYDNFSANTIIVNAEESERKDVKVTKVDQAYNTAACFYFDLDNSRSGNGTNVNNLNEVGDYIYYNKLSCKNAKFDVHMRSNMFWFYPKAGTTLAVGDIITFRKGLHFPVVTNDGEAVSSYKDFLGDTIVYEFTDDGWVNKTELNKNTEQKVNVTGIAASAGNGQTLNTDVKFLDAGNDHNYTNTEDWVEVSGYILYNGEPLKDQFDVHMMSGNFYVYPNSGFTFKTGDSITILEGLHLPINPEAHYGSTPSYDLQKYSGYISETYTIELDTSNKWIKQATASEPNTLKTITEVKENEAGATMPASFSFTANFELRVSKDELTELENSENYSKNIFINDKSIFDWNETTSAENNDGDAISAISISAYGTSITFTVVKSTNIIQSNTNFSIKVSNSFVCSSGNTIEEDIVRYYISGLEYWSTIAPYEIEKNQALTIKNVDPFEVIDSGSNGAIYINFNEDIAPGQMLAYNCHPEYLKTLPDAYPVDKADDFASSGSTLSFINNVFINEKSMAEYWDELASPEAKFTLYQCHIMSKNQLRIGSSVSNGFDGNSEITITLKKGLIFFNGAYLDHDVLIKYTPKIGENDANTSYNINAEKVEISINKTTLIVEENGTLTCNVTPLDFTGEISYYSSNEEVAKINIEDGVVSVNAQKAGETVITAKVGTVTSNEIRVMVKNPAATKIVLEISSNTLEVGKNAQLTAKVTPELYDGKIEYISSDTNIATISENGEVTAIKDGTVVIKAKIGDLISNEISLSISKQNTTDPSNNNNTTQESKGCKGVTSSGLMGTLVIGGLVVLFNKKRKNK